MHIDGEYDMNSNWMCNIVSDGATIQMKNNNNTKYEIIRSNMHTAGIYSHILHRLKQSEKRRWWDITKDVKARERQNE